MKTRSATARWEGALRGGQGIIRIESIGLQARYTFASRFEEDHGTNPEELIAAAHAGCFSMQLSFLLGKAGFEPRNIDTVASATLDKVGDANRITNMRLLTEAAVPGIDNDTFQRVANDAKTTCPVSQALAGVSITLKARLLSPSVTER
jgi:lipoyl-dependent peroxiredoxin